MAIITYQETIKLSGKTGEVPNDYTNGGWGKKVLEAELIRAGGWVYKRLLKKRGEIS
jgi:hypothetical protein